MSTSLLAAARERAAQSGLNLFGLVDAARFDAAEPRDRRSASIVPRCGTIVVLGSGGRALQQRLERSGWNGLSRRGATMVSSFARVGLEAVADELRRAGVTAQIVDERQSGLNLGRLAEAAGFGTVSPVAGMLLHPEYGPWLRVRGALLLGGHPFGAIADASISDRFQPCCNCSRPCVSACSPGVHDGAGHSDAGLCATHRHNGGCGSGCRSRMACPLGREHADAGQAPVHGHSHDLGTVERWHGLGVWRLVPRAFRGGHPLP